jgi:hypothetical protein
MTVRLDLSLVGKAPKMRMCVSTQILHCVKSVYLIMRSFNSAEKLPLLSKCSLVKTKHAKNTHTLGIISE